jgi:3-oxoacyl-[acyl-carrier-protein] synthase II
LKRVVVTGMAGLSPIGNDWETVKASFHAMRGGVKPQPDWAQYKGLNTQLGAPIVPYTMPPERFNRKNMRSMGIVAKYAVASADLALIDAGLRDDRDFLQSGGVGVAFGSSTGSPDAVGDFAHMLIDKTTENNTPTTPNRRLPHSTSVNVAVYFGLRGRVYTTSTACTSGSQAIGLAYEAIRDGRQVAMVAGGAEELTPTEAAVFDTLFATSCKNQDPEHTPRPYDRDRDGLVVGEGAGTVILEELEHAKARGARIYAEVVGFGTNCDGSHVTQPYAPTQAICLKLALDSAGLDPGAVDYVNGHGTATGHGDIAETTSTREVFGRRVPISSFKGHMGHTLGACGALEVWMSLKAACDGFVAPTLNLDNVDPECADLDYVMGGVRKFQPEVIMSNNFAFGGINTSLIFKLWRE